MAYRIRRDEDVGAALRRIATEQVEGALNDIDGATADHETAVHEVRKRCKKIRGLLRLVRPGLGQTYRDENAWFRDTARWLSGTRDLQVMGRTFAAVCAHYAHECATERFTAIGEWLQQRGTVGGPDPDRVLSQLSELRPALERAHDRIRDWRLPAAEFAAVEPGLRLTYRRGRCAMAAVAEHASEAAIHEWRKRAKYHWYHARLLADCWRPVMDAWRQEADQLSGDLGDAHDLIVLRRAVASDVELLQAAPEAREFLDLLDRRQYELLSDALDRGRRLYAERPRRLTERLGRYWNEWRAAT